MKRLTAVLGSLVLAACATVTTRAAPFDVVNALRTGECQRGQASPLERTTALDDAARRIAQGDTLAAALAGAGYRARRSTFMRLSGLRADREVADLLRAHHCARISDPAYHDGGIARRGDSIWIVLAARNAPPAPADAARIASQALALVNEARAGSRRCGAEVRPAAAPLAAEARLDAAARKYARQLAQEGRFAHQGLDGSSAADRVRRAGYNPGIVGENLAAGPTSAAEAVAGWLASPGHCANLMDARFTQMGLAYAEDTTSGRGVVWVQLLAAPRAAARP